MASKYIMYLTSQGGRITCFKNHKCKKQVPGSSPLCVKTFHFLWWFVRYFVFLLFSSCLLLPQLSCTSFPVASHLFISSAYGITCCKASLDAVHFIKPEKLKAAFTLPEPLKWSVLLSSWVKRNDCSWSVSKWLTQVC